MQCSNCSRRSFLALSYHMWVEEEIRARVQKISLTLIPTPSTSIGIDGLGVGGVGQSAKTMTYCVLCNRPAKNNLAKPFVAHLFEGGIKRLAGQTSLLQSIITLSRPSLVSEKCVRVSSTFKVGLNSYF